MLSNKLIGGFEGIMSKTVRLIPSEIEFIVNAGQTVLEAAIYNNINLEYSCSNGQCGQCKAELIEGVVGGSGHLPNLPGNIELKPNEILTCCSVAKTDLVINAEYSPELNDIERKTVPVKVDSFSLLSNDVINITFRLAPTAKFRFLPGQFIDLNWNGSKRSYSIASADVAANKIDLHIKKVDRGLFSEYLFNDLKDGQLFRINGPLGTFFLRETDSPLIFMCTGTGFAPVKSMVEHLINRSSNRLIYIFWGAKTSQDLYSDLPLIWSKQYSNITFVPVLSREQGETGLGSKYIQNRVVDEHTDLAIYEVYACGSEQMISDARKLLVENGLKSKSFYSDAFVSSK